MWALVFFETGNGRRPVEEYLAKLGTKEKTRVRFGLELLEQLGLELRAPHVKSMGNKLWELRIRGQRQHRIFYFAFTGKTLILLHAFTKKTQQTPAAEKETAMRRMNDWKERMSQE